MVSDECEVLEEHRGNLEIDVRSSGEKLGPEICI